jgi:hypothetical protein
VFWKEYRTKKELARVSHLAPKQQLQEMPGSFTIALADIASYGLHINAIDLQLKNNQKLRFVVGTRRMDVELFLQRSRIPREQKS